TRFPVGDDANRRQCTRRRANRIRNVVQRRSMKQSVELASSAAESQCTREPEVHYVCRSSTVHS
ncbi:MAG: hypothetical protein BRD25_04385, partial [Bacteroidetes bacterium QH_1_61_8]